MSMNKVFEYCALGIPTACYPLKETKRLLGEAGVYAPTLDPAGLAEACLRLMQDEALAPALREGSGQAVGGHVRLGTRGEEICRRLRARAGAEVGGLVLEIAGYVRKTAAFRIPLYAGSRKSRGSGKAINSLAVVSVSSATS